MKKIVLLILALLLCTGCSKSITCKEKKSDNNYKIVVTDDNEIKEIVLTYIVEEKSEDVAKKTQENLRKQFTNAENFSKVKVKRSGKKVTLIADVDYSFFFNSKNKSIEEVKKYFEDVLDMKCYE